MGKKKDKKKSGAGAAKTAEKTAKKEHRNLLKETGEDDIENILAELNSSHPIIKDSQLLPMESAPSPRSNASLIPLPGPNPRAELFLFGGEFYDGRTTKVYNDTIFCTPSKKEFKLLQCPLVPPHRSAHQTVATERNGGEIYLFGGEFQSPSGSQFHHFKDFWVFSISTLQWSQIKSKGGPSPRSGHRMVFYPKTGEIFVFGGFTDNGKSIEYHTDLYSFNVSSQEWKRIEPEKGGRWPDGRSGFCLWIEETNGIIYLYGGCGQRVKATANKKDAAASAGAKGGKSGGKGGASKPPKPQLEMVTFTDLWAFNLSTGQWKELKKKGIFPSSRTGMAVVNYPLKSRAFFFGGVAEESKGDEQGKDKDRDGGGGGDDDDEEEEDEKIRNFNDLFLFQMEHESFHYYPVKGVVDSEREVFGVKNKEKEKDKDKKSNGNNKEKENKEADGGDGAAAGGSIFDFDPMAEALEKAANEKPVEAKESKPVENAAAYPVPIPRRSSHLCIRDGRLWLYGGVMESSQDREYTLGDWWELDIGKGEMNWKEIIPFNVNEKEWYGSDDEKDDDEDEEEDGKEDDEEDEDEDDEDSEEESEEEDSEDEKAKKAKKKSKSTTSSSSKEKEKEKEKDKKKKSKSKSSKSVADDDNSNGVGVADPLEPRGDDEKLPEYFNRNKEYWMTLIGREMETEAEAENQTAEQKADEKEVRRRAFQRASEEFQKRKQKNQEEEEDD